VVDDDPVTLKMMTLLIASMGHKVLQADSAEKALKITLEDKPDILLSDIGMPNRSGWALLEDIRNQMANPPVAIAVSGHGTDEDIARSQNAGFRNHLIKPVNIEQLRATIEECLTTE